MKKIIFLISLTLATATLKAQNYQISFAGTGASTTVDSVIVQNLTQCTSIRLGGNDILNLVDTTAGINEIDANAHVLNIFPNPFTEYCNIEFEAPVSGNVVISIYNITGKEIAKTENYLQQGKHKYQISGINSEVYFIQINSKGYSYYGKLINNGCHENGIAKITYQKSIQTSITGDIQNAGSEKTQDTRAVASVIQMQYNAGDTLKLTGIAGIYRTIFMLIPTGTQTVIFNFIACTDADGNNYTVVQIGSQIWMAENLKTTHYRNGDPIPNVTDNTAWIGLTTGAYCNYNNNVSNVSVYGRLYNWFTVNDSRNIAPEGWHVATDAEWTTLTTLLGGESVAGGKIKENCSTHWVGGNTGATDEVGFTALPGGLRNHFNGAFSDAGYDGYFWCATEYNITDAWSRYPSGSVICVYRFHFPKILGYSVRCVRD